MTREVIEDVLYDKLFMDLHMCARWVWINDLLLNTRKFTDIIEEDIIIIIYRQAYTNIREQGLTDKGYWPKVLPRTYKQTYIVIQLCTKFCSRGYLGTYKLDSDPEGLICIKKY